MFGGGYAMLPLLEKELIEKRQWVQKEELLEILALSQMTPGTIAINAATYIGNKFKGFWGGLLASAGIILPSLLIVSAIYYLVGDHFENDYVKKAFMGIRACLVAMILHSVYKLFRAGVKGFTPFLLFLLCILALFLGLNPILAILIGAFAGWLIWWLLPYLKQKNHA